jgi:hypothetical protein
MRQFKYLVAGLLLLISNLVMADEGMWLLPLIQQLNIHKMQQMGCRLSAEDIYSINHSSMKDAIVMFDGGCTGEIVSDQGLLLTNHHCGVDAIQKQSSVDHDFLDNGFWAKSKNEELVNHGLTVTFLVKIEDVSSRILPKLTTDLSEADRQKKTEELGKTISDEAIKGTHYSAEVESFFGGNSFYLLIYETFTDVRLVGTPPKSIGNYGADTDNWMWPRHTGDFSVFRVYTAPDGTPAPYSPKNIPLKPHHFLPVSTKGVKKGDFTMVMGYPGGTDRYLTSFGVKELQEIEHPNRVKIRGMKQDIWMQDMTADKKVYIQYATKYQRSSNYWKFSIGQEKGIENLNIIARKLEQEKHFMDWVNQDPARSQKYGNALNLLQEAYSKRRDLRNSQQYISEALLRGAEIFHFAYEFMDLYTNLRDNKDSLQLIKDDCTKLNGQMMEFFKNYHSETDKKVTTAMLDLFSKNVLPEYQPEFLASVNKKYKNNFAKYTEDILKKSIFTDSVKVKEFLQKPELKKLLKDPVFEASLSIVKKYYEIHYKMSDYNDKIETGMRLYIAGSMEMSKDSIFYPDANFTMRMTYGTVGDYFPRDAVHYDYYTTLKGVMEKEDSTNAEFIVPSKLKELYKAKDFGNYAENGVMKVDFTTNNDITGGNSGSPVINGNGELIGLAFDGNWEAMTGDIQYESELQKCICVDIRYVLFIMDKFASAKYLVDEMKLVN